MMEFIIIVLLVTIVMATIYALLEYRDNDTKHDSKSPYDVLLQHLEEENGRLLKEANTLKAIRRLETLNESLRNEIETNTPEYEEEPSQDVYGRYTGRGLNESMDEVISTAKDYGVIFSSVTGASLDEYASKVQNALVPIKAIVHVVEPGDTLSKIARKYGTSSMKIVKDNGLDALGRIRVGQKLKIY